MPTAPANIDIRCPNPCSIDCTSFASIACVTSIEQELQVHHSIKLELCNKLEKIADGLPNETCSQEMLIAARRIIPTIKSAHRFEEGRVFPLIETNATDVPQIQRSLERLRFEHWEDESFALELQDALTGFVAGTHVKSAETLGYMLRGFFEGVRRHIAFEIDHIVPMIARGRTSLQ